MNHPEQTRRNFIKTSSAGLLGAGLLGKHPFPASEDENTPPSRIKDYRILGRTAFRVSDIGFGSPKNPALIKAALNAGVNYLDTAPMYGSSQADIGKVIGEYDRKSIFITTKIPSRNKRLFESKENVLKRARKNMEVLKVEHLDCLMLQAADSCDMVKNEMFHDACDQLMQEGRLKHRGISCHGSYFPGNPEDTMQNILLCAIEDGRFDLLLVVYNYLYPDEGGIILKEAKKRNIGTTVMKSNPVKMYQFMKSYVDNLPEEEEIPEHWQKTYKEFEQHTKDAYAYLEANGITSSDEKLRDVAIRFALDNQDNDCTLSMFENFDDLEVHLGLSGSKLSADDRRNLDVYRTALSQLYCRHGCTVCESACPNKFPINTIMRYNYYFSVKRREKEAMAKYARLAADSRFKPGIPDVCGNCPGYCQKACPYAVSIQPLLAIAHNTLSFSATGSGMV
jgi:predicted aldo/keto reductase-like oxidoreductase